MTTDNQLNQLSDDDKKLFAEKLAEVTKTTGNALKNSADIISRCRQICEHDPSSQECKDCQPILNKGK